MTSADRPRRPALTSSTPAVPGTYPRNSSVLSTNRWGLAARRPNLKQNPTSYFSFRPHPNCNSPSSTSPSPSHTPQFSPLQPPSPANFDIRFTVHSPGSPDSEFSTRAFAGTGSSRGASPLPSPLPTSPLPESTPAGESETLQVPTIPKTAPLSVDGTFPTDKDMNTKHDEKNADESRWVCYPRYPPLMDVR
ncbi:hypothetical protein R3P38DRAFT_3342123 [Favolaschia claudopus]|uniref:Uncharacterized protein n=1 Tax=Favolaschia claudopus TaxID=2862362 RepID=A0AAW0E2B7_9AGAR